MGICNEGREYCFRVGKYINEGRKVRKREVCIGVLEEEEREIVVNFLKMESFY